MNLFDTHAHIDWFASQGMLDAVLERARAAGVAGLAAIGGSEAANRCVCQALEHHAGFMRAAVGFDRDETENRLDWALLDEQLKRPGIAAVGETGLDYHYQPETAAAQRLLFSRMLERALAHRIPVVVHSREAEEDTLALLRDYVAGVPPGCVPGILHCFTASLDFAEQLLELGFFISFSGIITFSGAASIRAVAMQIPADRLLVETDCPYLAPVPHRGKRNEPAWVELVVRQLAEIRGVAPEQMAELTTNNAWRVFSSHPTGQQA